MPTMVGGAGTGGGGGRWLGAGLAGSGYWRIFQIYPAEFRVIME